MARVRLQGNEDLTELRLKGQIDWNTLSKEIVQNINNVKENREGRINAISEATKKLADQAENNPIGRNTNLNDFSYDLTDIIKKSSYQDYTLLKSGEISSNDYLKTISGRADQIKNVYDTIDGWNTNMEEVLKRNEEGLSSEFELDFLEKITGIADFNKLKPMIVPSTGRLAFASQDGDITHILDDRQMKLAAQFRANKVDLNASLAPKIEQSGMYANQFLGTGGSVVEFLSQTGDDQTPEGIERRKQMNAYLDSIADEVLANPYTTASILTDIEGGYNVSLDGIPKGANRDKTLLTTIDPNGRVNIDFESPEGKKQEDKAREIIKNRLAVMMDEKRRIAKTPPKPTKAEIDDADKEESDQNVVSNVAKLYYGDEAEVTEAEEFLTSLNPIIQSIDRTPDGVRVSFFDGRPAQDIPFTVGGEVRSQGSWVTGSANFFIPDKQKISDVNSVLGRSSIDLDRELSNVTVSRKTSLPENPIDTFDNYIGNLDESKLREIFRKEEGNAAIALNEILEGTGLTAVRGGRFLGIGKGGEIKIKDIEGKTIATFDSDPNKELLSDSRVNSNIKELKEKLKLLTPEEVKISFVKQRGIKPTDEGTTSPTQTSNNLIPPSLNQ